jgi:hypothetical protein
MTRPHFLAFSYFSPSIGQTHHPNSRPLRLPQRPERLHHRLRRLLLRDAVIFFILIFFIVVSNSLSLFLPF